MNELTDRVRVDVLMGPNDLDDALRLDVRRGLTAQPKELPPKWFYDDYGCELFDAITRLPEYYPTRREREILRAHAGDIARASAAHTLVELGSGSSEKTRWLLDVMREEGGLQRFIPFDVSEAFLRQSAEAVARDYPGLAVHAVVGDFEHHLGRWPRQGRALVAFLGGTIGNLKPHERARFYAQLAQGLAPGDGVLVGTDLLKSRSRLFAAYNDRAGVTAAFNRNVLAVLNHELGADFDLDAFEHLAPFDEEHQWMEMRLISTRAQAVRLPALERFVNFAEGEVLRTEVSCKFHPERVQEELTAAGFEPVERWTDAAGDFALSLARKR